nr:MAG: capsid protein [Enontekio toti-like virus 1]
MCYQPIWSSAEACAWQSSELVLVLGTFSPTRARIRTNLSGAAYVLDPNAIDYVIKAQTLPMTYMTTSAIYNYYMWYGLYAIVASEAQSRDDWRTALTSVPGILKNLYTPHMRAICLAAIVGHEIPTSMSGGAGFYVSLAGMSEVTEIPRSKLDYGYNTITDQRTSEIAEVKIDALYAPVSGSLILGTLAGELEAVQHLKSIVSQTFRGVRDTLYDSVELTKVATMYRLFGHDVVYEDNITRTLIKPWGNVSQCIPEPASIWFDPRDIKKLTIKNSDPRHGRCVPLPNLGSLTEGTISMTIERPFIEFTVFGSRKEPLRTYITRRRDKPKIEMLIKPVYSFTSETFRTTGTSQYKYQDFREESMKVPPQQPEVAMVEEPEQTTAHAESSSVNADTVDWKQHQEPTLQPKADVSNVEPETELIQSSQTGASSVRQRIVKHNDATNSSLK